MYVCMYVGGDFEAQYRKEQAVRPSCTVLCIMKGWVYSVISTRDTRHRPCVAAMPTSWSTFFSKPPLCSSPG